MINELERKKNLFFFLLSFFVISFAFISVVSAVAPVTTIFTGEEGFEIQVLSPQYMKLNEAVHLQFHVYNKSNGEVLTNDTPISCQSQLVYRGIEIGSEFAIPIDHHFTVDYNTNNISNLGPYGYVIHCNGSMLGGFYSGGFTATPEGRGPRVGFFIIIFVFAYGLGFIGFFGKNEWISIIGGMACLSLGLYTITAGIDIYRNFITLGISYFTIAMGAIFTLIPALEMIEENFGNWK